MSVPRMTEQLVVKFCGRTPRTQRRGTHAMSSEARGERAHRREGMIGSAVAAECVEGVGHSLWAMARTLAPVAHLEDVIAILDHGCHQQAARSVEGDEDAGGEVDAMHEPLR